MTATPYRFADSNGPTLGGPGFVLWMDSPIIQRFDWESDRWVEDRDMAGIYVGKILTLDITEEQARGVIERKGGTWCRPVMPMLSPELERTRELRAQMQANADSVPAPVGIEGIEDMGTVVPFWTVLGEPGTVIWSGGNQMRVWRFDYSTDEWVLDPETPPDFIGTRETAPISSQEAEAIITHNGGTWKAPKRPPRAMP